MIRYDSGSFGFQILFRLHGSAIFKSLTPALISSCIYMVLFRLTDLESDEGQIFDHPYPMGALISALTFLLAFRANFSYNRFWEACGAVHQMHSKWLDCGMEVAAFHLQSARYDSRKPPAFGNHPELESVERERERTNELTLEELAEQLDGMNDAAPSLRHRITSIFGEKKKSKPKTSKDKPDFRHAKSITATIHDPTKLVSRARYKAWDADSPPLFLLETAHLLSLLSAVALSTLRNDLEEADSPLITFKPGVPWPAVDPDAFSADVRKEWASSTHRSYTILRYLLGLSRTPATRTLYNAARPFRVIGGVSDAEIELLQAARGPLAKVALVSMWWQEFLTREYLAGSTGKVAPPILSRLYQFTSDGMLGYNQARKVAYIPFPFPHAQITSLFVLIVVGFMPVLMLSFLTNEPFGFVINLLTVMCFTGLHEVARELEAPFQNVPNDIPLNNFQAQYNESLMTMFTGFHPDAFWEVQDGSYPPAEMKEHKIEATKVVP